MEKPCNCIEVKVCVKNADFQTADKGTEREKRKYSYCKVKNFGENFPEIFIYFYIFFVWNEPRLTVLSTALASVRPICTLSQQSAKLMTRFVISLGLRKKRRLFLFMVRVMVAVFV